MNYYLINFGDKEKKLLFDFNAISLFDEIYGKSLINVISDQSQFGFRLIQTLYYVGLKNGRDQGITFSAVGNLLYKKMTDEDLGLDDLMRDIFKALDAGGLFKGAKFSDALEESEEAGKND